MYINYVCIFTYLSIYRYVHACMENLGSLEIILGDA
jgi:hypothetical protein